MVGIWSKFGQGWNWVKTFKHIESFQNGFAYGESLSSLRGNILSLFRTPNSILIKNKKDCPILLNFC